MKLKLKSLISIMKNRFKIFKFLWQYKHFNSKNLINLSQIDFIVHKVKFKKKIKSFSKPQKRMPAHKKWWMKKLMQNDLNENVYEYVKNVNERLFFWNAQTVMIDKSSNTKSNNEFKMIFDYNNVIEKLSEFYVKLNFKIHDHLFNFNHGMLFSVDLKHVHLLLTFISEINIISHSLYRE